MNRITLTPQKKSELGLMLSASDIEELLKDPSSWVAKLYNSYLQVTAIKEEFFIYLCEIFQQEQLSIKQQLTGWADRQEQQHRRSEAYWQNEEKINNLQQKENNPSLLPSLQINMLDLLKLSQDNMTLNQLTLYHQLITTNFNNQISAKLGNSIVLPFHSTQAGSALSLKVPQKLSRSIATLPQLLKHNPILRKQLELDDSSQQPFIRHVTISALNYLTVINKTREILEYNRALLIENGIDVDNIVITPQLTKEIDMATKHCLDENYNLVKVLIENNTHTLNTMLREANKLHLTEPEVAFQPNSAIMA